MDIAAATALASAVIGGMVAHFVHGIRPQVVRACHNMKPAHVRERGNE